MEEKRYGDEVCLPSSLYIFPHTLYIAVIYYLVEKGVSGVTAADVEYNGVNVA